MIIETQPNNPLHGITLAELLTELVTHFGWDELGQRIDIRCFNRDPSIASSLKFLRRTPWARAQVEALYVHLTQSERGRGPGCGQADARGHET